MFVGLIIIGWLIWYFIFRSPAPAITPQSADFTLPGEGAGATNLMRISTGPVVSAHFNDDNSILFYDFSGKLWRYKIGDSKSTSVEQTTVEDPAEVIWSLNGRNIIKAGLNQSDADFTFSDFNEQLFTNLRADIKSAAFSPDGKKIAYYVSSGTSVNSLYTSDYDGKNQKLLAGTLKLRDFDLSWPKNNTLGMASKPSGLITGDIWVLNTANSGITKLLDGSINALFGLETLWSPSGDSFIYSYVDSGGQNPKLAVYKNGVSKNISNISTIVDKCAWAKDSISVYCAIPQSWPSGVILPDDYYKSVFLTADELWKINTETGEKNLISPIMVDVLSLDASVDDNSLIFILKNNNFLYKLDIK